MSSIPRKAQALILMVLVVGMALMTLGSARSQGGGERASLKGQLLVAPPSVEDPRFAHAVILMVRHDKTGAFGLILNQPLGEVPLADLLESLGLDAEGVAGRVPVYAGGPVEPVAGFILHSAEYHHPDTTDIDGRMAVTSNPEVLRDIGRGKGPKQSLVIFGYSGWGAGQLEAELADHRWFTATPDPPLVFETDRMRLWDAAMARRTLDL
jgi:putative transcriptional regulator